MAKERDRNHERVSSAPRKVQPIRPEDVVIEEMEPEVVGFIITGAPGPQRRRAQRTPDEQQLVDDLARLRRRPLTEQEADFAIEQARAFGEL